MDIHNNNLILFPKWKSTLENESKEALKDKRYGDALQYLNKLSDYDVNSHEVLTGKLICLMELGEEEEAEELCEKLLDERNEHYYEYLHIYSTLLFQASKYAEVIELLDNELNGQHIPEPIKTQLIQVSDISKNLNADQKKELGTRHLSKLKKAVDDADVSAQWGIIEKLQSINVLPQTHFMEKMLIDDSIHDIVKAAIIDLFRVQGVNKPVELIKFNQQITVHPSELSSISNETSTKQILELLEDIEQDNPSLFELIKELLYRYMYVRYPIMPIQESIVPISEALNLLGYYYLQLMELDNLEKADKNVIHYINEIIASEKEYFSVIKD
ncbi:tetratricopeptide repeat protein [Aquibacillus rhizosphaerae]|uniref:Tetratricopeptide repeat protein n=1 Tax=Aquibacillus rhizosphaerae TaxID=3051431 RepID=A0ABT7L902_9BACI|nr:tetratricopeptide repeat protein [Aquibacillus sp. LR5S19]MDL4841702.1 tetratricopeptide repeat protein [Aquibacillus sp. LR5S19]